MKDIFENVALPLIRKKAKKLVGKFGFTSADRADLEQELALRLWRRLKVIEQLSGNPRAFCAKVIKRGAVSLIRKRNAVKRPPRNQGSLNDLVVDTDGCLAELAGTIVDDGHHGRLGTLATTPTECQDLAIDVAEILQRLPEDLRAICERLKYESVAAVARDVKVNRMTLVRRLRRALQAVGIDSNFFENL